MAVIGFDIGTGYVKLAQCGKHGVEQLHARKLPENLVRAGEIISFEAMSEYLCEMRREYHLARATCAVILPAQVAFMRRVTLPAMSTEQLRFNLPYEFRDYAASGKEKFFYDYAVQEILRDEQGKPTEMNLLAAAASKAVIGEYRAMFRRAGLHLRTAIPAECAYANLMQQYTAAHPDNALQEYCIIDIGQTATRLHIFDHGNQFDSTRVIDIGTADLDRAIAEARNVDEHIAHTYMDTNHDGVHDAEEARGIYSTIAVESMKTVNFYRFNNRNTQLEHGYYCGGGACIAQLVEMIGQATGLKMHHIGQLMPGAGTEQNEETLLCAAAMGATMQ